LSGLGGLTYGQEPTLDPLAIFWDTKLVKQLIRLTILFCACAALALTVMAGPEPLPSGKEMKQVAPAPLPECNWTGFYIGLNVGGQFGHSETKDIEFNYFDRPWGYSESGVVAGGQVGYNYQWNWLVLGVEIDGGYMNLEGRGAEPGFDPDAFGESDSDFYTTFRGRLGIARHNWLFYATGGGIGVNYKTRFIEDVATAPNDFGLIDAHKQEFNWGYTVGGGLEYMFGCHWSIKAEYLYFALDRQQFSGINTGNVRDFGNTHPFNGDTAGHIVRAGLNYKF
jgi:outer membrane immunogenic protein